MPAKNFGCEAGHVILLLQGRLGSTVFLREERYYPVRIVVGSSQERLLLPCRVESEVLEQEWLPIKQQLLRLKLMLTS